MSHELRTPMNAILALAAAADADAAAAATDAVNEIRSAGQHLLSSSTTARPDAHRAGKLAVVAVPVNVAAVVDERCASCSRCSP